MLTRIYENVQHRSFFSVQSLGKFVKRLLFLFFFSCSHARPRFVWTKICLLYLMGNLNINNLYVISIEEEMNKRSSLGSLNVLPAYELKLAHEKTSNCLNWNICKKMHAALNFLLRFPTCWIQDKFVMTHFTDRGKKQSRKERNAIRISSSQMRIE